jgi:hypothetical protein
MHQTECETVPGIQSCTSIQTQNIEWKASDWILLS